MSTNHYGNNRVSPTEANRTSIVNENAVVMMEDDEEEDIPMQQLPLPKNKASNDKEQDSYRGK